MASRLEIDFDLLQNTINDYDTALSHLQDAVNHADRAMNSLRSSKWDTEASVAYFAQYSEDWKKTVQNHMEALKDLNDGLKNAMSEYSAIYDQIGDLKRPLT